MDENRQIIHKNIEDMIIETMNEYQCDYQEARALTLVALLAEVVANIASLTVKFDALEKKLSNTTLISAKVTLN